MTEDAIRRQKADLLLEHKEAEDHLKILIERAYSLNSALEEYRDWFAAKLYIPKVGRGHAPIGQLGEKHKEAMQHENWTQLFEEISSAREKLDDLTRRKRELNL